MVGSGIETVLLALENLDVDAHDDGHGEIGRGVFELTIGKPRNDAIERTQLFIRIGHEARLAMTDDGAVPCFEIAGLLVLDHTVVEPDLDANVGIALKDFDLRTLLRRMKIQRLSVVGIEDRHNERPVAIDQRDAHHAPSVKNGVDLGAVDDLAFAPAHRAAILAFYRAARAADDVADACHERGIRTVAVTAGYVCAEPRREFFAHVDAANVDLKGFSESFYHQLTGGQLAPVLETLKYLRHETKVWLEITTLVIPGANDSDQEFERLTAWVAGELGPDVPLHFSAFHPAFRLTDRPRTPHQTLIRARQIALTMERLRWTPLLEAPRTIAVNVPEFALWAYEANAGRVDVRLHMRVVVGRALDTGTPLLVEDLKLIEFSPYWNVPNLIITPHISCDDSDYAALTFERWFLNLERLLAGKPLHNRIDPKRGY